MSAPLAKRIKILPKPSRTPETIIPDLGSIPTTVSINEIKSEIKPEPQFDSNFIIPITIKPEPVDYDENKPDTFSAGTSMDFVNDNLQIKIEPSDSARLSELIPKKIYKIEVKEKRDFGTDMADAAFETKDFNGQVDFGPDVQVKEIQTMPIDYDTFSCQVDFPEEM